MTILTKDSGVLLSGSVMVSTTNNRGFTPEEISARAADKIISIGETSHPVIREQAQAFKAHIQKVVEFYLKEAVKNDRVTIANRLREAGHPELDIILKD
jgi:hypothetical protein